MSQISQCDRRCGTCVYWEHAVYNNGEQRVRTPNPNIGTCLAEPPSITPVMTQVGNIAKTVATQVRPMTQRDDRCRHWVEKEWTGRTDVVEEGVQ